MKNLKLIGSVISMLLLILSLALGYVSWTKLAAVRDSGEYEDAGVMTFTPYQVLPAQVKKTSTGRDKRLNPTKTVYLIYYKADNNSGYEWTKQVSTSSEGERIVTSGVKVKRRLLRISAEGTYLTVEPQQTAKSYTTGLRQRYMLMLGAAAVYIAGYSLVFFILHKRKSR